ncbi:hypothetical protein M433DRAFT_74227 [Acidomyces richmondensis BFW]|nr:MAG: hypothetical protein FE78DRAFT_139350 [Acidomyces sp. 'richmondensis']KYG42238.1 hypothetical protein M433DRAFT_74227 [Acidomyces richmondensis BFW]
MAPRGQDTIISTVADFTVLPIHFPPLPSYPKTSTHYLYLRANAPKIPTEDTPREVFLVNVPVDATEMHLRSLFADQLGGARIESVAFEGTRVGKGLTAPVAPMKKGKKRRRSEAEENESMSKEEVGILPNIWDRELHRSGGTAIVTFIDQPSAQLALKEARKVLKSRKDIIWGLGVEDRIPSLGYARYLVHHQLRYPDAHVLQMSVDNYMSAFAAAEEARVKALARQRNVPDEDGFVKVTRGGKTATAKMEDAKAAEEEFKKREKNRVKEDFYRFQVREKRKEHAKDLVKAFEEDRKKVEEMRKRKGRIRPE